MNLKLDLDQIYQNVYRLNESLSKEDFDILIAGFEDGINEGFGKWLGKTTGKIYKGLKDTWKGAGDLVDKTIDKTKDLYKRGKEFAAQSWEKIKLWVVETGKKIKEKANNAVEFISTNFKLFLEKIAEVYRNTNKAIKEALVALKDKSAKFLDGVKKVFSNILESIKSGIEKATDKFISMKDGLVNWIKTNWTLLKKWVVDTKDTVLDKLSNTFNRVIEAIKNGAKVTSKYIGIIVNFIIIKPALMISNSVKRVPELYREYLTMLKNFIRKQIEDFKLGFEETSGRPWDKRNSKEEVVDEYPDMRVDSEVTEMPNPEAQDVNLNVNNISSEIDNTKLTILRDENAKMVDVQRVCGELISNRDFMKRFSNYNEKDFRSILKQKNITEKSIDLLVRFWKSKLKSKTISIPENFRYLKTFEGFKKES